MTRAIALLAVSLVAALAATPVVALAQDNPFLPDQPPPQQQPVTPPAPPPPDDGGDGDVSTAGALAIGAIVVALIAGIWIAISRDARRNAPRRVRAHSARTNPDSDERSAPGAAGRHKPRSGKRRKPSRAERERRKRGRAR